MANLRLILSFIVVIVGWSAVLAQEALESQAASIREPRSHHRNRLCRKYGICEGQGYGQGGYQGNPINIAISQSQSSANEGGGGYGHGYTPNNYQYNHGYPSYGGSNHEGYPGYGYHGYNKLGYYGNEGGYNNQFNGNYYGGQGGGYGFRRPYRGYDEDGDSDYYDNYRLNDDSGSSNAAAGSFAEAGSKD